MKRKIVVGIMLTLLILSTLTFVFEVRPGKGNSLLRTPRVDELLITIYPDRTAEFTALNASDIDIVDSPLTAEWVDILNANPDVVLANYSWIGMFQLDLNNNETLPDGSHNPCNDHEFRHALAHLVNRTYLVETVCEGLTLPMYTPIPPALAEYVNPDVDKHSYSPSEAASILDIAGYADTDFDGWRNDPVTGQNVNLTFYYRTDLPYMTAFSEWYQDQLISIDLGFTSIPIVAEEAFDYVMIDKNFHLYTGGWSWEREGREPDFLYELYHSSMYSPSDICSNYVHFNDTEYDDFSKMVKYTPNFEIAREAVMECQRILASAARIGVIPLWCSILQKAYRKYYGHWLGEEEYWDRPWVGMVNEVGYGVDSGETFLNCHPEGVPTGGKIRWGFRSDIEALNPVNSSSAWDRLVLGKIYDTLLKYNPYNLAEDIPCMAESYEVRTWYNPDTGTDCVKLIFNLKDDIYFRNGVKCTAEDVKFTINYIKQFPNAYLYPSVADVHHVDAPSPFTAIVYENITSYWTLHQIGGLPILPRHIWKNIEDPSGFAPDPDLIGTGPFEFHSYVPNESIRLLRNPDYMRPRIYVDPPISYVRVGEAFSINVNLDHVADLYGFEFRLGYDTALLDAIEVVIQPFLNEPTLVLKREINEDLGFVWVNVTSQSPAEPVSGSGTLATIFFQVVGFGECVLDLYSIRLSDPDYFRIDHSVEDGYYEGGMTQVVSTESPAASTYPSLAVDSSGNIHIAWQDDTNLDPETDTDIFYKRYEVDSGWTTTEVVSTESTSNSFVPSLAVDSSGNIHIAWHDDTNLDPETDTDIFYKRYEVGSGWTTTEVVSTESNLDSFNPSLAVDLAGNVHIAWHDYTNLDPETDTDIFYKRYEVGSGWTTTEVVSTESTSNSFVPSLAVDSSGNIHIAWHDFTNYRGSGGDVDIFYKRYEVARAQWTLTEVVSTESNLDSFNPSLAVDLAGNVHIAWHDYTDLDPETDTDIFHKRYEVASAQWTLTEVVSTESTEESSYPSLAVDSGGNVHIAWQDDTDLECGTDRDIFYKNRTSIWSTTEVASTESTSNSYYPFLTVDSHMNVHIAWHDYTDYASCGGDVDIFYKRYEAARTNWTRTEVASTESSGNSFVPSLAVDSSGNIHIAWHDWTDYAGCGSDTDIFYKYLHLHATQYPWSMFHHNLRHTGYTESPAPNTNKTQWTYTTDDWVESSPAVAYGMVFVGSNDGNVYALDQYTGARIWNYPTGNGVVSSAAVADGKVYVGSLDTRVYCLDAVTGAHIWNHTTEDWINTSPAVASGKVYVGSYDGKVYCLDATTGEPLWNRTTGNSIYASSPAVAYGKVFVGSLDGKVYCLDTATGEYLWNRTIDGVVYSSPAVGDGKVFAGSGDGKVYCLDATTGEPLWNRTIGGVVFSSPAVAYGKVFVGSGDGKVYCLDATTGEPLWNRTIGDYVRSSPAVADDKVYVGSADGKVYCLDAATGTYIWNYTTENAVWSSPAVADGMVFVGSNDHTVYALGSIIRVPEDYPTIQEAIDAADPGDTISIAPGTYHGSSPIATINKSLTLLGRKGSSTTFAGGGSGIAVNITNTSQVTITNIEITYWDQGIYIDNSSECNIYNNIMYLMDDSGIVVEGDNAANNVIYNNIFQDNTIAIDISESSTGNTIYANTISQNDIGINVLHSSDNTIYCNSFINNGQQVNMSNPSSNAWDNGCIGNYWSDYTGTDADGDGIGDTPHVIDGNNQDNYPLMSPYEYWSNPMLGDINKDTKVDYEDLLRLAAAYGSTPQKLNWNSNCDFNKDYKVEVLDLFNLSKNYGKIP